MQVHRILNLNRTQLPFVILYILDKKISRQIGLVRWSRRHSNSINLHRSPKFFQQFIIFPNHQTIYSPTTSSKSSNHQTIKASHPLKMVITVTIKSYEHGHRFNVTMNSVEDNVLALKVAIKNYNSLALELENIKLLFGASADLEDWRTLAHYNIDDGCTVSLSTRNTNLVSIENGSEKISVKADLDEISKSLNQIKEGVAQIIKGIQKHGTPNFAINKEFAEKMKELSEKTSSLNALVPNSVNIHPIRKRIQLILKNCRELSTKDEFCVFSPPIELVGFKWHLQASVVRKGFLALYLHAIPPNGFTGNYRIEVDRRFSILNTLADKELNKRHIGSVYTDEMDRGWGFCMAKLEDLLDSNKTFLTPEGDLDTWVDFTIKSATLNHLTTEKTSSLNALVPNSVNIHPIRKRIQFIVKNCRELLAKDELCVNSRPLELLGFKWYLQAQVKEKGFLALLLHAIPPNDFKENYRIEVNRRFSILNTLVDKDLITEYIEIVYTDEKSTGWGNAKIAKLEDLLDSNKTFLTPAGDLEICVDFTIKSSTLNHLT